MKAFIEPAEVGEAGQEPQHVDKVIAARMKGDYLIDGKARMARNGFDVGAEAAAVAHGDADNGFPSGFFSRKGLQLAF